MDEQFLQQCLLLHSIPNLTRRDLCTLLLHYGDPPAVCASDTREWRALGVPAGARASARLALRRGAHPRSAADVDRQLQSLRACEAAVLTIACPSYPPLLRAIPDPPPLLYTRGDSSQLNRAQLAVVGARRASPAGLRAASELGEGASRSGLVITSGLAIGIDGAAHRGALDAAGATVAVLACGVEKVYPARHRNLAAEILEQGCLVTEFPPGMQPLRENFPRRNRIVTGLSLGTLVVEAALPSGSLISAASALEQGREVFTLPWSIYHTGGAGCLRLLADGAHLVLTLEDILDQLGPMAGLQRELFTASAEPAPELSGDQRRLYDLVGYEVVQARDLVQLAALPVANIMAGLSALELKGLVVRCEGGYIRS